MPRKSSETPGERLFVDANLFLRYLTDDVPVQASAVEQLLRAAATGQVTLITHSLVIAEVIWTLESFYRLPRREIQEKADAILATPGLEVEDSHLMRQALADYAERNVDFVDAFSAAWMLDRGLRQICTFDRRHFARLPGLTVIVPGEDPA